MVQHNVNCTVLVTILTTTMAQKRNYLAELLGFGKRSSPQKNTERGLFSSGSEDAWTRQNESLAQAEERLEGEYENEFESNYEDEDSGDDGGDSSDDGDSGGGDGGESGD
jgi:hypothetical protein